MLIWQCIFLLILGLIFGSLGSVIFFRLGDLPTWKTLKAFFFGRSQCRHCHHTLHAIDLIPLRSFFSQWGKCRYCHKKLSRRYPTLEIWSVAIFIGTRLVMGIGGTAVWTSAVQSFQIFHLFSFSFFLPALGLRLLLLIFLYDLKTYELHITATILLLLLSLIGQRTLGYGILPALQSLLIFFLLFLLIYYGAKRYVHFRYKEKAEGFGFGDVIMAGVLGSLFPAFLSLTTLLDRISIVSLFLVASCCIGLILYAILTYLPIQKPTTIPIATTSSAKVIPFLPAMILAFLLLILFGNQLLSVLLHP